jgi:hypothetical protein
MTWTPWPVYKASLSPQAGFVEPDLLYSCVTGGPIVHHGLLYLIARIDKTDPERRFDETS